MLDKISSLIKQKLDYFKKTSFYFIKQPSFLLKEKLICQESGLFCYTNKVILLEDIRY